MGRVVLLTRDKQYEDGLIAKQINFCSRQSCKFLLNLILRNFFWDVCWPTILRTHGIGLAVVFSHGISPIKERIVTRLCMVLFFNLNNLCDYVGETMRA